MKKSLVALAILAVAGVASAQSSVTLYGVADATFQYGSGNGVGASNMTRLGSGGDSTSRVGFRGTEDLGKGMSASFVLEAGLNLDHGAGQVTNTNNQNAAGTAGTGLNFNRRSTVSLTSGMGELRLGRDVTPHYWNHVVFDPFGPTSVGSTIAGPSSAGIAYAGLTSFRASNSIGYFLPGNLGGFYGQGMLYRGENAKNGAATENDGNGAAIRLGYANGPINVALATSRATFAQTVAIGNSSSTNLGGSFNFGAATAMAVITRDRLERTVSLTGRGHLVGVQVPMGAGQIRASYSSYKTDAVGTPKSNKIALGYLHNLSKRTALYAAVARVTNSGGASIALNGAVTAANNNSSGYNFGLRHSF